MKQKHKTVAKAFTAQKVRFQKISLEADKMRMLYLYLWRFYAVTLRDM